MRSRQRLGFLDWDPFLAPLYVCMAVGLFVRIRTRIEYSKVQYIRKEREREKQILHARIDSGTDGWMNE
jgi:hypothetical protein